MPIISYGLLKANKIEDTIIKPKFFKFIKEVYNRYSRKVQYHNDLHGADVAYSVSFLANQRGFNGVGFTSLDILLLIVASLTHDVGHDGFTTGYH
jgi:hypothetical protein